MKQFCRNGHDTFIVGRRKHGHCKKCHYDRIKRYREKRKAWATDVNRKAHWKRLGILLTADQYNQLLRQQNWRCAVCDRPAETFKRNLAVDHNHKSGEIRGLLCGPCNRGVVKVVEDYSHLIDRAQEYLSRPVPDLNRWSLG